ncbi:VOC family protein [bacterium]|nr:VOC family protein [bacterium]
MLNHIGLEVTDKEKARIFFEEILGIPKVRGFTLSSDLAYAIFGRREEVETETFTKEDISFEVFIAKERANLIYAHTCLEVQNREEILAKCKSYGLTPNIVKKGEKELLFIRDFSGNLFEIKG